MHKFKIVSFCFYYLTIAILFLAAVAMGLETVMSKTHDYERPEVLKKDSVQNIVEKTVFKEHYFSQFVDHFNFRIFGNQTYKQRYLITDQYWKVGTGPIFFYTGNEGDIYSFQKASGFVTDLAAKMDALVVFAEHRFYGTSLPFGEESFNPENIGLLSMEQAMADFATLIRYLKKELKSPGAPVVTFGGSYGGQLAAYMRIRYPNLVAGALSASAPLYWITGFGDQHGFWKSVTRVFANHTDCRETVVQAFDALASLAQSNKFDEITSAFKTCRPVTEESLGHFYGWIRNAFTDLAMMNYPYPTNFLAPLPAHPVKAACEAIVSAESPVQGLVAATALYYNGSDSMTSQYSSRVTSQSCFDTREQFVECADPTGCGLGNDAKAWDYQACTEIVLPGGTDHVTDMFPLLPFTSEMRAEYCQRAYGVTPRTEWSAMSFWTEKLELASNIIFSNGDLDPWADGGVQNDLSPSLPAVLVVGGAHHFDLRGSNPLDPASVVAARLMEEEVIRGWLESPRVVKLQFVSEM